MRKVNLNKRRANKRVKKGSVVFYKTQKGYIHVCKVTHRRKSDIHFMTVALIKLGKVYKYTDPFIGIKSLQELSIDITDIPSNPMFLSQGGNS